MSFLKLAREWWIGGGSNICTGVRDLACDWNPAEPGRDNVGGRGSSPGLLPLLGGVLKGEALSLRSCTFTGVSSPLCPRKDCLLGIFGFSARLTGGGPIGSFEASRRSSADLRGGGGSGGCTAGITEALRDSNRGVWGLLGILNWRGDEAPDVEDGGCPSAVRKAGGLASVRFRFKVLGGELGGSIVTAGETDGKMIGPVETGLCRPGLGGGGRFA
jgi:hypothetical protein